MANGLRVKVTGRAEETGLSANTVGDLRDKCRAGKNSAAVNGSSADDMTTLRDGDFITFMPNIKGNK